MIGCRRGLIIRVPNIKSISKHTACKSSDFAAIGGIQSSGWEVRNRQFIIRHMINAILTSRAEFRITAAHRIAIDHCTVIECLGIPDAVDTRCHRRDRNSPARRSRGGRIIRCKLILKVTA